MPKLKTHRGAAKRFKFTASGVKRAMGTAALPSVTAPKVGSTVSFEGKRWFEPAESTDTGVVTKTNADGTCEVYGAKLGTTEVHASKLTPTAKRDEATVLASINNVYGGLSPENLCCDGEASAAHIRRVGGELRRALKALFTELGRKVSEGESYGYAS